MGLLDSLLSGDNSHLIGQLAQKSGLGTDDLENVIGKLLPSVSKGIQNNIAGGGLGALIGALSNGNHQQYLDNPETITDSSAVDEGNSILGHVLGSKENSRSLALQTAESTGIDSGIIKSLLPLVANMVMGSLSKQATNSPIGGQGQLNVDSFLGAGSSPITSMITSFLDADNDGDITDDLLNMAKKFF